MSVNENLLFANKCYKAPEKEYPNYYLEKVCLGEASSMASILLGGGTKGKRVSLPNSRIMIHQPSGGYQGQATDIEIHARETLALKKRLNEIYVKHTGQTLDKVEKSMERDNFMTPEMAVEFGLIDKIMEKRNV